MTTQEKIRRLASEVLDVPEFPRSTPHPVIAGPPFAIRKTPLCSECAANTPIHLMVPAKVAFYQEARTLFMERSRRTNHRRRTRPSLARAVVACLLATTSAVLATLPQVEDSLADMVPVLIELGGDAKAMVSGTQQDLARIP